MWQRAPPGGCCARLPAPAATGLRFIIGELSFKTCFQVAILEISSCGNYSETSSVLLENTKFKQNQL